MTDNVKSNVGERHTDQIEIASDGTSKSYFIKGVGRVSSKLAAGDSLRPSGGTNTNPDGSS